MQARRIRLALVAVLLTVGVRAALGDDHRLWAWCSASSVADGDYAAFKANNGIYSGTNELFDCWASAQGQDTNAWWQADLSRTQAINSVHIQFRCSGSATFFGIPKTITFQVSDDGSTWTTIGTSGNVPVEGADYSTSLYTYALNTNGRYVRLLFEAGGQSAFHFVELAEVEIYGPTLPSPACLVVGDRYNQGPHPMVEDLLEGMGFAVGYAAYENLTEYFLKHFNVVVMPYVPANANEAVNNLLLGYVNAGGSLLMLRTVGYQLGADIARANELLEPTGIEILNVQVVDTNNCVTNGYSGRISWSSNTSVDPVTVGVTGLFYPQNQGTADLTSPVKTNSGNWKILFRGMPAANATPYYSSEPPLLAVGDHGAGRIAVWPTASSFNWIDAGHLYWGSGFALNGISNGMAGNAATLLTNLFAYLSAKNTTNFGGYFAPPSAVHQAPAIDWDKISLAGWPSNYVGLIGAQSSLSVGADSPQNLIEAAKIAGYDFICFTEELSAMDAAKWDILANVCAAACNNTFRAYPGYKYLDESGNSWVIFSDKLPWIGTTNIMSANFPGRVVQNRPLFYPFEPNCPPIILLSSHLNPEKPWHQGGFHGFSVYTYTNGLLVDDSLDNYKALEKMQFAVFPTAVHIVTSTQQVNYARTNGYQANVRWSDNNVLSALIRNGDCPAYVSASSPGPILENFSVYNAWSYWVWLPSYERMRLHIKAYSPNGLEEVCIWDGDNPAPWRRFKPGGAETFEQTLDCFHDKQYNFFVTLTDNNGKKAVSWEQSTFVEDNRYMRCSDNMNTMPRGIWFPPPAHLQNPRGIESYSISDRSFAMSTFLSEGSNPSLDLYCPAIKYYPVLASRFGTILDEIVVDHYNSAQHANLTDLPSVAVANTQLVGRVRQTFFTPWNHSTMAVLTEGKFTNITAVSLNLENFRIWSALSWRLGAGARYCATAGGSIADNPLPLGGIANTSLPGYGLVGVYPNQCFGSAGAVSLQNSSLLRRLEYDGTNGRFFLLAPNVVLEPGGILEYKLLGLTSKLDPPATNAFIAGLYDTMGLDGTASCIIVPASASGEVTNTAYVAQLAAQDYGFAGTISETELPINLPVFISGLNPRWDAGILYKGTNILFFPKLAWTENDEVLGTNEAVVGTNQLFRFPVMANGVGMLQLDTAVGEKDVFIGNLLVCDNTNIVLSLTDTRPGRKSFVAHNMGDTEIVCTVQPGPGFSLLGKFRAPLSVPAGSSVAKTIPTVSIVNPAADAELVTEVVTIDAVASAGNGYVTNVVFYRGSTLLGTDTNGVDGWNYTWGGVAPGAYSLTAVAYFNDGITASNTVNIATVNDLPVCTLTATYDAASIIVTAVVANTVGSIANVSFYANGSFLNSLAGVLGANPVACYRMNETTGSTMHDSATREGIQNGIYRKQTLSRSAPLDTTNGPCPNAFNGFVWNNTAPYFNGSDTGYAWNTNTDNAHAILSAMEIDYSVELWLCNSRSTNERTIAGYFVSRGANGAYDAVGIGGTLSGAQGKLFVFNGANVVVGSAALALDTWYHVAVVRSNNTVALYLNGNRDGSGTLTAAAGSSEFWLGVRPDGYWPFQGGLDDVAIYSRALSAGEVLDHYNAAISLPGANPVACYRMNETTGSTMHDSATNAFPSPQQGFQGGFYRKQNQPITVPLVTIAGPRPAAFKGFSSNNTAPYFNGSDTGYAWNTNTDNAHAILPTMEIDYSVELWLCNSRSTNERLITGYFVSRGANGAWDAVGIGGTLNANSKGKLFAYNNLNNMVVGSTVLALDTWYHVAIVRSNNTVALYLNGNRDGSGTLTDSAGSSEFWLGVRPDGYWPFQGGLDDVAIYSRALSAGEVLDHYNAAVSSMYTYAWTNPPPGQYGINACSWDSYGANGVSQTNMIAVATP